MAFHQGERHIIEIDGPSHYANFDETTRTYSIDEGKYAQNLKIARSLQRNGWTLTRIGRSEVRAATEASDTHDFAGTRARYKLLSVLPFPDWDYPDRPGYDELGLPELAVTRVHDMDEIPF